MFEIPPDIARWSLDDRLEFARRARLENPTLGMKPCEVVAWIDANPIEVAAREHLKIMAAGWAIELEIRAANSHDVKRFWRGEHRKYRRRAKVVLSRMGILDKIPSLCSVCVDPACDEIEASLRHHVPKSRRFGITPPVLARHRAEHMPIADRGGC